MPTLSATVPDDLAPERLDRVALALFAPLASLSQVRKLARKGHVLVDGRPVEPMTTAHPGQRMDVHLPDDPGPALAMELELVYVDDWMAVVNKPAGLVTSGPRRRTLVAALAHNLSRSPRPDAMARAHPVHRLDARTRGLIVVARTHAANVALGRAFQQRLVKKRYRALLRGALTGEGEIDLPIDDRPAHSRWRSVEVSPAPITEHLTTVDLWPETGRRHQLRRHVAALGHPILGDGPYTPDGPLLKGQGLMLAAVELSLPHPATGEPLHVVIDEPSKLVSFRERARRRAALPEASPEASPEAPPEAPPEQC